MRNTNWYVVWFLTLLVQSAAAQIPQTMSYQGRLTDTGGNPVANGNYSLTFRLYDVSSGGAALWTETQASVPVNGAIFSVMLGSVTPFGLPFDKQYWLGVSVQGGAELTPRTALSTSPYSIRSLGVLGSNNIFPPTGNVGIGTTSPQGSALLDVRGFTLINRPESGQGNVLTLQANANLARLDIIPTTNGVGDINTNITGSSLTFSTVGTEQMRIGSTGNIGIGIVNLPTLAGGIPAKLHLQGTNPVMSHLQSNSTIGTWLNLYNTSSGGNKYSIISTGVSNGEGPGRLMFIDTTGSIPPLTIYQGKVGMGTTAPAYPLEVKPSSAGVYAASIQNTSGTGWGLRVQSGSTTSSQNILTLYNGATTDVFNVRSDGNVGIGTASPVEKLEIGTYSTSSNSYLALKTGGGNLYKAGIKLKNFADDDGFTLESDETINKFNIIRHATSSTVAFTIDRLNGNVGIGATTPARRLDVRDGSGTGGAGGAIQVGATAANGDPKLFYFGDASYVSIGENTSDDRMELTASTFVFKNGYVGLGGVLPSYGLDLPNSSGAGTGRANAWITYSSRRWKENIKPISDALNKVERLRGVSYDWKTGGNHDIGLIAEEVGEVIPEIVDYEDNGKDAKGLDYARLVAVLIEAVKELDDKSKDLQSENEKLEARLSELESVVKALATSKAGGSNKSIGELRSDEKK